MTSPPTKKLLVVISGPTASGKTDVGVQLALRFNSEIISADSRQFYRQMQIGTARPSHDELQGVPHHFLGFLELNQEYSSGRFAEQARKKIDELFLKRETVFVVGGSGFYIDALIYGMDDIPKTDPEIRQKINADWKKYGLEYLQKKVEKTDPDLYQRMDINNPMRLIRALEVYEQTGNSLSSYQNKRQQAPDYPVLWMGLDLDRSLLYSRINQRVDHMIGLGLLDEVEKLHAFRHLNALQTVGYSELFEYLDGTIDFNRAVELIKRNTRRYAKRQLTWLRRYPEIMWFNPGQIDEMAQLINDYQEYIFQK